MVEISPKALRFSRLAAEQQPAFSGDPQIDTIKREEMRFRVRDGHDRLGRSATISEATAEFCYRAVTALLRTPDAFSTPDWDGNDFAFMQAFARDLQTQLGLLHAQSL